MATIPANRKAVLVVAPHPDDETLGPGGTLARRADEGCEVRVAVLSDGRELFRHALGIETDPTPAEVSAMRYEETRRAMDVLGVGRANVRFLGLPDGELADRTGEAADRLAAIVRGLNPAELFVTSEHEHHPDHVAANRIARAACRLAGAAPDLFQYITSLRWDLTLESLGAGVRRVDVRPWKDAKRRAIAGFRAHLEVISPGQIRPLVESWERYITDEEPFIEPDEW